MSQCDDPRMTRSERLAKDKKECERRLRSLLGEDHDGTNVRSEPLSIEEARARTALAKQSLN